MSTTTPNLLLVKPASTDFYDIAIHNANMDLIDAAVITVVERAKLAGIEASAEANNISDANALDLTDGGDSTLHYHAADRSRANHTGTQGSSTISDFGAAVRATILAGLSLASSAAVVATDTILVAIGKLQTQINEKIEATDVTFENLNTNGDVGTGATQLAQGDHSHPADDNKADLNLTINAKTANYTLVLGDNGELLNFTSATGYTLNIPLNSSVAFAVGTQIVVLKSGAGDVTIDPATGVTLNDGTANLVLSEQYKAVSLLKVATDTWVALGPVA